MGTKNNVNPDHYKEQGRERPGQDINQEINKQKYTQTQDEERIRKSESGSPFTPGQNDTSKRPEQVSTGHTTESSDTSSNR